MCTNLFEKILSNHHLDHCPKYLWQIKTTDAEYEELRQLINQKAKSSLPNCSNRFITITKECLLYIAEFWRREYDGQAYSVGKILKSLKIDVTDRIKTDFYKAAHRAFEKLKFELFENTETRRYRCFLDSMLYQGGLPMRLITSPTSEGAWDRFTRGLVNRRVDFGELKQLGAVASSSKCLKDYCYQLIQSIETNNYQLMPFYCKDENNFWFQYLIELAKQERIRRCQLRPFDIDWTFKIDKVAKRIYSMYTFNGKQKLPEPFIKEQGLENKSFFTVQIQKNGQVEPNGTFDFKDNYCRYEVSCEHSYKDGDLIALYIDDHKEPLYNKELNMAVPQLIYRNIDDNYRIGNRIEQKDSLVLIPNGWSVKDEDSYVISDYLWGDQCIKVLELNAGFDGEIILSSEYGTTTFGMNRSSYWTELATPPIYQPDVEENIYDANSCKFKLCSSTPDGIRTSRCFNVIFQRKLHERGDEHIPYGIIYAKAIDTDNNFVEPIRFINVGNGLNIQLLNADEFSCRIRIRWEHGQVTTTEGVKKSDDTWEIKKEDCSNSRKISFRFIPDNDSTNSFNLSIKAPFREFSIENSLGECIQDKSLIPFSDIDSYRYHLVGQDAKFKIGDVSGELKWDKLNNRLLLKRDGLTSRPIPYEGNLSILFGSRKILSEMLESTSKNMLNAQVPISFSTNREHTISYIVKEYPYVPVQMEDGTVIIKGQDNTPIPFTGMLKLLDIDNPGKDAITLQFDKEKGYVLPDEIRAWRKALLIGASQGRIRPALIDLNRFMDNETRRKTREEAIESIDKHYEEATIDSNLWGRTIRWFHRIQTDNIPASSLLELYCLGRSEKPLLHLAFLLFIKCVNNDEKEELKRQLISFSKNIAFQWYWISSSLKGIGETIMNFVGDPSIPQFIEVYVKWALQKSIDSTNLISVIGSEDYFPYATQCFTELIAKYEIWLKELCLLSLSESFDDTINTNVQEIERQIIYDRKNLCRVESNEESYITRRQNELQENTINFFLQYNESNKPTNENWLYQRVKAVAAHLNGEIDLFVQSDEIKRSIIYASKSYHHQFIYALNNELIH
jgi:hypothetical protein